MSDITDDQSIGVKVETISLRGDGLVGLVGGSPIDGVVTLHEVRLMTLSPAYCKNTNGVGCGGESYS